MTIYRPELTNLGAADLPLKLTNPRHIGASPEDFLAQGSRIAQLEKKIGAEAVVRAGSFEDTMLRALDGVSGAQQFSSSLAQQGITDPDSVDVHDITIAQAKASMALNITRNVLSRVVQGWRDLINAR
jgi:flagellar hook-basal body complex protein FliE